MAEEGVALMEKAAGQGHAHAMEALGSIHAVRKEYERALEWFTKGAEAGYPAGADTRPLFGSTKALSVGYRG